MHLDRLKFFALALPQTTVVSQWGGLGFKVAEKVFSMIFLNGRVIKRTIKDGLAARKTMSSLSP